MPEDSELMWLPGIGIVEASSGVTCETTKIERTAGLEKWTITSDGSGITSHYFEISNGIIQYYGNPTTSLAKKSQTFYFSPKYPMVGLFGWTYGTLQGVGTLEYNSQICPRESDQPSAGSGSGSGNAPGVTSQNWWEATTSDNE